MLHQRLAYNVRQDETIQVNLQRRTKQFTILHQ